MEPMNGKWASCRVDLGYTELFCIPEVHQCSSRFVTVYLASLWCSIKKIEAPYMFDWEYGIALPAMQENRASFPSAGMPHFFSSCRRNLGYIRELQRGWPFETPLCSAKSGLLCSYDGQLRNLNLAWQDNTDTSGGEVGDEESLSSFHRDIGIPINFQEESSLSRYIPLDTESTESLSPTYC